MKAVATKPRLGFVGVGWIGCRRMESLARSGLGTVACVMDVDQDAASSAAASVNCREVVGDFDEVLDADLEGVVIATPSADHASQCLAALERGLAVFCQKPLARTASEAAEVVAGARKRDLLLGVDMSYRHVAAFRRTRSVIAGDEFGVPYVAELEFHNGYGPDKQWFTDPARSGGGCLMDLGTHLIDFALWTLGWPEVDDVSASLFRDGSRIADPAATVEDHALVSFRAADTEVRMSCSWFLSLGKDADVRCYFHGPGQSIEITNVRGSFYDFEAHHHRGRNSNLLAQPPDEWGGRALQAWARELGNGAGFNADAIHYVRVAEVLDAVYGRAA